MNKSRTSYSKRRIKLPDQIQNIQSTHLNIRVYWPESRRGKRKKLKNKNRKIRKNSWQKH